MYNAYFDSGTTNTRIYILDGEKLLYREKKPIGSKNSAKEGSNEVLIKGLYEMYLEALAFLDIKDSEIENIFASGMISSSYGFCEVAHVSTPASAIKLADEIFSFEEKMRFKRIIKIIPGVKTVSKDFLLTKENVEMVGNMRGEEIELMGMLAQVGGQKSGEAWAVFLPGSHTHIAYIKNNEIADIFSMIAGELWGAVASDTILSGAVKDVKEGVCSKMLKKGYEALKTYGFNRALYIARGHDVFKTASHMEIKSFMEGVVNGGVVDGFLYCLKNKWKDVNKAIVLGREESYKVLNVLWEITDCSIPLECFESDVPYSLSGLYSLMKYKKLL